MVFFDDVIPTLLALRPDQQLHGKVSFHIDGLRGGQWTINLDARRVICGSSSRSDLSLRMRAEDFEALTADELDFVAATTDGRLRWTGDLSLLDTLADLLEMA